MKRGPRCSVSNMLQELEWLNVRNLYHLESICWLNRVITTKSAYATFTMVLNGARKKQKTHNTRDCSLVIDADYNSRFIRQSFIYNSVQLLNSLKIQRKIVPPSVEYRELVKEEILKKYDNLNIK